VAYGLSCVSETRVCANGVLSGSYINQACVVNAAEPCNLPWGGTIVSGQNTTAYQASSVACGLSCVSETRVCANGVLSGSYINQACSVAACVFTLSGNVKGALTGRNIDGASVSVWQAGVQIVSATTGSDGKFEIRSLAQNPHYKIVVTGAGYKQGGILDYAFNGDQEAQLYLLPSTFTGLAAIVLSWTGIDDLDAHMTFSAGGTFYHLSFMAVNVGGSVLDLDNTNTSGQETVTIGSAEAGVEYNYYVHSYHGGDFNTTAKVQLFDNLGMLIREFTAQNRSENYWNVFKFTPSTGALVVPDPDSYNN
jgi:hypothetical protein